jgi:DNA-binding MarR family transcriptional regulator
LDELVELTNALKDLGLTEYEAKVYITLVRLNSGNVSEIAHESDVPRPKIYETLSELEKKDLVEIQFGKPRRYRPTTPEVAIEKLAQKYHDATELAIKNLKNLKKIEIGRPEEVIWTLRGGEQIINRIQSMLPRANSEIIMGIPIEDLSLFVEQISDLCSQGIRIRLTFGKDDLPRLTMLPIDPNLEVGIVPIILPNENALPFTHPGRHIIPPGSRIVVIDENEILFTFAGVQESEIGIWAKSPGLVFIFKFFYEQFWKLATLI